MATSAAARGGSRGRRTRRLVVVAVVAVLVVAAAIVVPLELVHSGKPVRRPTLSSCRAPTASAVQPQIPFAEVTTSSGPVLKVAICINRSGPYSFVVSTGAGQSVIGPDLQQKLKLAESSPAEPVRGATCDQTAPTATVSSISMGGVALVPQPFLVAPVPSLGLSRPADGMIGSDVLERFGAVRFDYKAKSMTMAGAEGAAPTRTVLVLGKAAAPPSGLVLATPTVAAVAETLESPSGSLLTTSVTLGTKSEQFLVDTAAPTSTVAAATAAATKLSTGSATANRSGIGCTGTASSYESGSWSLGGSPLPRLSLASQTYSGAINHGLVGALGSDVLESYGSVVIDYSGALLWLGAG